MQLATIDAFLAINRQAVAKARIALTAPDLTPDKERELWQVIDCAEQIIKMRACSFEAELEQIDRELENQLRR